MKDDALCTISEVCMSYAGLENLNPDRLRGITPQARKLRYEFFQESMEEFNQRFINHPLADDMKVPFPNGPAGEIFKQKFEYIPIANNTPPFNPIGNVY